DVDHIAVVAGIPTAIVLPSGRRIAAVSTLASVDGRFLRTIERPRLLAGSVPDQDSRTDVLVNRFMAAQLHLSVGSRFRVVIFPFSAEDQSRVPVSQGTPVTLRVAGIGVTSTDVVP